MTSNAIFDLTLADANTAIELDPKNSDGYYLRAHVSLMRAKYDEAIADTTKAIQLDPRAALAYEARGLAYGGKGDAAHAIADLQTYLKLLPNAEDRGAIEGVLKSLGAPRRCRRRRFPSVRRPIHHAR